MIDPVRAEVIRTLYRQGPFSTASALLITAFIVVTASPFTSWQPILLWALCTVVLIVLRLRHARRFAEVSTRKR